MATTVYHSFNEINKELEILKVEKDLAYARFMKDLEQTKESLEPMNLIGDNSRKALGILSLLSGPLKSAMLTWLFKKVF